MMQELERAVVLPLFAPAIGNRGVPRFLSCGHTLTRTLLRQEEGRHIRATGLGNGEYGHWWSLLFLRRKIFR